MKISYMSHQTLKLPNNLAASAANSSAKIENYGGKYCDY